MWAVPAVPYSFLTLPLRLSLKIYQNPGGGDGVRTSMVMIKRDAAVTANGIKLVGRKLELPARLPQRAYERKIRKAMPLD